MSDMQTKSAQFIHGINPKTGQTHLMSHLRQDPRTYFDASGHNYGTLTHLHKQQGVDFNAPMTDQIASGPHDPRSAFIQGLSSTDPSIFSCLGYCKARPRADEDVAGAFPWHEDGYTVPRRWFAKRLEQLQKYGTDLTAPIQGKPAGHAWARAAVAGDAQTPDDYYGRTNTTHFVWQLARAGVDFAEKDQDGRDARDVVRNLVEDGFGLPDGADRSAETKQGRSDFLLGIVDKAISAKARAEKKTERDAAITAAAQKKADRTTLSKTARSKRKTARAAQR